MIFYYIFLAKFIPSQQVSLANYISHRSFSSHTHAHTLLELCQKTDTASDRRQTLATTFVIRQFFQVWQVCGCTRSSTSASKQSKPHTTCLPLSLFIKAWQICGRYFRFDRKQVKLRTNVDATRKAPF